MKKTKIKKVRIPTDYKWSKDYKKNDDKKYKDSWKSYLLLFSVSIGFVFLSYWGFLIETR